MIKPICFVLGEGKQGNTELLNYLKTNNYSWIDNNHTWEDESYKNINMNHNILYTVHLNKKEIAPVKVETLSAVDLNNYYSKAIPFPLLKEEIEQRALNNSELENQEKKSFPQKKQLLFVKISEAQILGSFNSKYKDEFGNTIRYSKIILPSQHLVKNAIHVDGESIKSATIIVQENFIINSKFKNDENKKIFGLLPDKDYKVLYKTEQRNELNHFVEKTVSVKGKDLFDAFTYKNEKNLEERIEKAKTAKENSKVNEQEKGQKSKDVNDRSI